MQLFYLCSLFLLGSLGQLLAQSPEETDSLYTKLGVKTFKVRKKVRTSLWSQSPKLQAPATAKPKTQPKKPVIAPEWQLYALAEEMPAPKDRIYLIFSVEVGENGKVKDLRILDSNHLGMVDIWVQKLWKKKWKSSDQHKRWIICLDATEVRAYYKVLTPMYNDDSTDN